MTREELEQARLQALDGICCKDAKSPYYGRGCECVSICENGLTEELSESMLELLDYVESLHSIINQLNNISHGRKEIPPV